VYGYTWIQDSLFFNKKQQKLREKGMGENLRRLRGKGTGGVSSPLSTQPQVERFWATIKEEGIL